MKEIIRFFLILFLEITSGLSLSVLYWLVLFFAFSESKFYHSRVSEGIYYVIILMPPFIYCLLEHLRLKNIGDKTKSTTFIAAAITYLIGGFISLLLFTNFYLLNG